MTPVENAEEETPEKEALESSTMAETAIIELAHVRATNQEASEVNKMKVSSDLASLAAETAPTFVSADAEVVSLASSISEHTPSLSVKVWDKKTMFADYVRDSLSFQGRQHRDVVMLFESPSTSCSTSSFFNSQVYKFHDYPLPSQASAKLPWDRSVTQ